MPPNNSAAWLPAKSVKPLQIGPAPYTPAGAGQIVVKNRAVAINPVDWGKHQAGNAILGYIKYPFILGGDVAGDVVEVGPGVERFRVGDRVLGQAAAAAPTSNNPAEGAFQHYTIIREHLAAPIPNWMSYEQACVLPLALLTAAYGLFHQNFLALDPPTVPPPLPTANKRTIIITGGSSSVGSCAVQLAVSVGYQVYSTASPKNFAYVEKLGATRVFDYHSATLVDDMVAELKGTSLVGMFVIGDGFVEACSTVLRLCGSSKKFIAFAGTIIDPDQFGTSLRTAAFFVSMILWFGQRALVSCFTGVCTKFVEGEDICEPDNVATQVVFRDFFPQALASGQIVPALEPLILGKGLDKIQEAIDLQKRSVSAQKIVVLL
ncbi:GroES-like protein [Hypoxylon crocopeplum]|nr:GroES-like protein [Hypoxylon crocopeplum]